MQHHPYCHCQINHSPVISMTIQPSSHIPWGRIFLSQSPSIEDWDQDTS